MKGQVRSRLPSIGFGLAFILTAVAALTAYLDIRGLHALAPAIEQTERNITYIESISISVERIVNATRIFVLTGNENFIEPMESWKAEIESNFDGLRAEIANPDCLASLGALHELVDQRVALSERYIELRRELGLIDTVEAIPMGGESLAGEIRMTLDRYERQLREQLEERYNSTSQGHVSAVRKVLFLILATGLFLLIATFESSCQIAKRVELERQVITSGEQERQRIARDIHDGLGQELTGVSLRLEALYRALKNDKSTHVYTVRGLISLVQGAIGEARAIARSLAPGLVRDFGLETALRALVRDLDRSSGKRCEMHSSVTEELGDNDVALQLYRIAQEALTNAVRHSGAKRISVYYECSKDLVQVSVLDDGIGISADALKGDGIGLRSMQYRAQMLGGSLTMKHREEGGTVIRCVVKRVAPRDV